MPTFTEITEVYVERVMGIEPTPSAWKAEVLPLNYTRLASFTRGTGFGHDSLSAGRRTRCRVVEGEGFEPSKAEPADLQSAPFDRSGTPPKFRATYSEALTQKLQPSPGSFLQQSDLLKSPDGIHYTDSAARWRSSVGRAVAL